MHHSMATCSPLLPSREAFLSQISTTPTGAHMKCTPLATIAAVAGLLASGCGGGGDDSTPTASITYFTANGLQWSSTGKKVINPPGIFSGLETTAQSYCSQQTCDQGGGNCRYTNFNGQPGWRVPTTAELQALYKVAPRPPGWEIGPTWTSTGGVAIDFSDGHTVYNNSTSLPYFVTCVRPA